MPEFQIWKHFKIFNAFSWGTFLLIDFHRVGFQFQVPDALSDYIIFYTCLNGVLIVKDTWPESIKPFMCPSPDKPRK